MHTSEKPKCPVPSCPNPGQSSGKGKFLGLGYAVAGAFFLFEPFIGVWDFLPDAIGFLLLSAGFRRLAELDERLSEMRREWRNLSLIALCRWVAVLLVFGLVSDAERPAFMLLVLFTLAVLDLLVLFPAWRNFREGFLYLSMRLNGRAALSVPSHRRKKPGQNETKSHMDSGESAPSPRTPADTAASPSDQPHRNVTERYVRASLVFFVCREVLTVLPELTVLSHRLGGAEVSRPIYGYIGLIRMGAELTALILGLVWLALTLRYVRHIASDTPFFVNLREKYREICRIDPDRFNLRKAKMAMVLLGVSAALTVDFYMDSINILPDFLAGGCLLALILLLNRLTGRKSPLTILTVAGYSAVSLGFFLYQLFVFNIDDAPGAIYRAQSYPYWVFSVVLAALCAVLQLLSFALVLRLVFRWFSGMTGHRDAALPDTPGSAYRDSLLADMKKHFWVTGIFCLIAGLSTVFHWGVIPYLMEIPADPKTPVFVQLLYDGFRETYTGTDVILHLVFLGVTISAIVEMNEQMTGKFRP